jgi:hypothetical protein
MGYSTDYRGELLFKAEPTVAQLRALADFYEVSASDHPEWFDGIPPGLADQILKYGAWFQLRVNDQMTGLVWDGGEKCAPLNEVANVILNMMRRRWPHFGLSGEMRAQGEDVDDRWVLFIGEDGWARRRDDKPAGPKATCPSCRHAFYIEAK